MQGNRHYSLRLPYTEADGEAAFYGPKLDIQYKNVWGKEDTIITVQVDFQLAEKFDMYYIDKDGSKVRPVIIHRTSLGCYERTLAMVIERFAGAFPTWLAPVQAKVISVSEKSAEYATMVAQKFDEMGIRSEVDKVIDAKGRVVMPGLVNTHSHVPMSIFRESADGYTLQDWLTKVIWPKEDKMTNEDVYYASILSFLEMIKTGTTTINDMYFMTEDIIKAAIIAHQKIIQRLILSFNKIIVLN